MKWNQEIFYNNIMLLIRERCNGNATIFNEKIHSRDAATRWKTKKPTLKAINTIMDVFGVSYDWITANKGEELPPAAPLNSDQVTLRDILKLREDINDLTKDFGKEIGDLKRDCIDILQRLNEAAETGDIKRLGAVGGKGK